MSARRPSVAIGPPMGCQVTPPGSHAVACIINGAAIEALPALTRMALTSRNWPITEGMPLINGVTDMAGRLHASLVLTELEQALK